MHVIVGSDVSQKVAVRKDGAPTQPPRRAPRYATAQWCHCLKDVVHNWNRLEGGWRECVDASQRLLDQPRPASNLLAHLVRRCIRDVQAPVGHDEPIGAGEAAEFPKTAHTCNAGLSYSP